MSRAIRFWRLSFRWVGLAALAALGCGGGQTRGHPFERAWDDETGCDLGAFVAGWRMPSAAEFPALAVGAIEGRALVGGALGSRPWRVLYPVEGQPILAGRVAVVLGAEALLGVDAISGQRLWTLPALGRLRGASDDGRTTLVSIERLSGRSTQVLAISRNGTVVRQIVEDAPIGAPVILDEFAFLPVAGRAVIVFDLVAGAEAARVIARVPLTRAFLAGDELYVGDEEVIRFDPSVVAARSGGGTRIRLPERSLPARPRWMTAPDGDDLPRAQLLAMPVKGRVDGLAYVAGPFVVGLDVHDARTLWVHRTEREMLAGRAALGGFVVCERGGAVAQLDSRGFVSARWSLGAEVDRCDVSASVISPALGHPVEPLWKQLATALAEPVPAFIDVQLLLVDDLARLESTESTRALEAVATSLPAVGELPEALRARAVLARHAKERLATLSRTPDGSPQGVDSASFGFR